jgi:hypothetical protein
MPLSAKAEHARKVLHAWGRDCTECDHWCPALSLRCAQHVIAVRCGFAVPACADFESRAAASLRSFAKTLATLRAATRAADAHTETRQLEAADAS